MKKPFFLSLNVKILMMLLTAFLLVSSVPLTVFLSAYIDQIENESLNNRKRSESVWEMYEENRILREAFGRLYENKQNYEELMKQNAAYLEPVLSKDRFFALQRDLLSDRQGVKNREYKMEMILQFILLFFCLLSVVLIVLWVVLRRFVLEPLERLQEGTKRLANREWRYRLETADGVPDELTFLQKNFNLMADSLENKVNELKNGRQFLQDLIDSMPDGVRVVDEDFNVIMANRAYKSRCFLPDPIGKKCHILRCDTTELCPAEEQCPVRRLKNSEISSMKVIQRFLDENKKETFVEVSASLLTGMRDGAQRQYTIEMLRPLEHEISFSHQQKLSSLGVLSSSVAHEMRNPLGSMRLILENLLDRLTKKGVPKDEMIKYLTLVYNQITSCVEVTDRLLKLARKPSEQSQKVCLNAVVAETASLMEYEAKKRGIEVRVEESAGKNLFINARDADLRIVTLNLLQNAFDAMETGGTMNIRLFEDGDGHAQVVFSDTGTGMPEDVRVRIFEPFFSTKQTQVSDRKGTGLGLSIVKTIVENHQGRILVESEKGKGTSFTLVFNEISAVDYSDDASE